MSGLISKKELENIIKEAMESFEVYEKIWVIPVTHLKTKNTEQILKDEKDYVVIKTCDWYLFNNKVTVSETRKPPEFSQKNGMWFLCDCPILFRRKNALVEKIPDMIEFVMNSYCPLFRDLDEFGNKYYYIAEDYLEEYRKRNKNKKEQK